MTRIVKNPKIYKICFWSGIAFLLIWQIYRFDYHHRTAADYNAVLDKLRVELPEVSEVESFDNYDRGASRWDCIEHNITFQEELSDKTLKKLEKLCSRNPHWVKEEDKFGVCYQYKSEKKWESDLYFLSCRLQGRQAHIEYYIDEDESLFNLIDIALFFGVILMGLFLYAIISSFRSIRENS
jgi:hypothetical protein